MECPFFLPALDRYNDLWGEKVPYNPSNANLEIYKGEGKVHKHHFTATVQTGLRFNYFQKLRDVANRSCDTSDSRRVCKVPISYLAHGVEVIVKFPLRKYEVTDHGDLLGAYKMSGVDQGTFVTLFRRPGYEVSNPYKIMVRYTLGF